MMEPKTNWDLGLDINGCDLTYQGDWTDQDTWNLYKDTNQPIKSSHRPIYKPSYLRLSWFLASWEKFWSADALFWEHQTTFLFYGYWIKRLKILYPSNQKDFLLRNN